MFFTDHEVFDYRSTLHADSQKLARFNQLLLERGIFKGTTKFYFSTEHGVDDVDKTLEVFGEAVDILKSE